MARKRMVTRTVKYTDACIVCVNKQTLEVYEKNVLLTTPFKTEKQLIHESQKFVHPNETVLAIKNTTTRKERVGIPEEEFIKIARKI